MKSEWSDSHVPLPQSTKGNKEAKQQHTTNYKVKATFAFYLASTFNERCWTVQVQELSYMIRFPCEEGVSSTTLPQFQQLLISFSAIPAIQIIVAIPAGCSCRFVHSVFGPAFCLFHSRFLAISIDAILDAR